MKRIFVKSHLKAAALSALFTTVVSQVTPAMAAEDYQSHDRIVEAATLHAQREHRDAQRTTINITPPDKRLKLQPCVSELRVFWPPGSLTSGSTTLGVECLEPRPWKIHLRAVITVFDFVAVVSVPVRRGDVVSSDNIELRLTDISGVPNGTTQDYSPWTAYRFKRQVAPGRPLTVGMIEPPKLVQKGESVIIINRSSKLTVRMQGTALSDGVEGARIRVLNNSSERIVQGKVVSAGLIQVNP